MRVSRFRPSSARQKTLIILAKGPTIFVYIATAVVLLNVLAGGKGSRRRNQKLMMNIVGFFSRYTYHSLLNCSAKLESGSLAQPQCGGGDAGAAAAEAVARSGRPEYVLRRWRLKRRVFQKVYTLRVGVQIFSFKAPRDHSELSEKRESQHGLLVIQRNLSMARLSSA